MNTKPDSTAGARYTPSPSLYIAFALLGLACTVTLFRGMA